MSKEPCQRTVLTKPWSSCDQWVKRHQQKIENWTQNRFGIEMEDMYVQHEMSKQIDLQNQKWMKASLLLSAMSVQELRRRGQHKPESRTLNDLFCIPLL